MTPNDLVLRLVTQLGVRVGSLNILNVEDPVSKTRRRDMATRLEAFTDLLTRLERLLLLHLVLAYLRLKLTTLLRVQVLRAHDHL